MFDPEEDYVMDFKAEENRTQSSHFYMEDTVSDCTTLSASEADSYNGDDLAPPLVYKLKKVQVMIKKLPRDVLAKYKINSKETPLRSSGRIKSKHIPVGKYLAVHENKPLNKVVNIKKKLGTNVVRFVEEYKYGNQKSIKKGITRIFPVYNSMRIPSKSKNTSSSKSAAESNLNTCCSLLPRKHLSNRFAGPADHQTEFKNITNVHKRKPISSNNIRTLHERIAATRIKDQSQTLLPALPDVVITRYDMPPTTLNNQFKNKETNFANTIPVSMDCNSIHYDKTLLHSRQKVQSKVVPAFITPAPSVNQIHNLKPYNAATTTKNGGFQRHSLPSQRKFKIQAFQKPNDLSKPNDPIQVASPRHFAVNQSLLEIDPLHTSNSEGKFTKNLERPIGKENVIGKTRHICVGSNSIDGEKHIESKVVKRIIYHTKSVQTKFTCNSSICGLVDSGEFNLNCFYCYEIFPLDKWFEFKQHIKVVHQVEEGSNLSDSDLDCDSADSDENSSQILNPMPKHVNKNGEQSFTTKTVNTTTQVYKKLPLEPRLLAERQNKITAGQSNVFSSTPIPRKPSQIIKQPKKIKKNIVFNKRKIEEVISLDTDDSDHDTRDIDSVNKMAKICPQIKKTDTNLKPLTTGKRTAQLNGPKMYLPSLPHITIKKVTLPKENVNTSTTTSQTMPSNDEVIKISSAPNVQKVIKTLPKPTANQLSDNRRPRYFVVKKIIKLPTTDETIKATDVNIGRGSVVSTMALESKNSTSVISANNIEDSVPKPTSGLGILFGLTNSMVVIEFLLQLKTFPELWCCQIKNKDPVRYNESIKKLCLHINNRFNLNMTEFEMLLSIQRVKDWYYLMLQSIEEHNKDLNNTEPYKHRFPVYFKILSKFLTPDADEEGIRLREIINETALATKANAANVYNGNRTLNTNQTNANRSIENYKITQPSTMSVTAPSIVATIKDNALNQDETTDSLIEFDADTLYDQESSGEEILEQFDESILFNRKTNEPLNNTDEAAGRRRRRTIVYQGNLECDICNKVHKRNCDLRRHRVKHFPPQYECDQCSLKYYYKNLADKCTHIKKKTYKKVDKTSGVKRIWPKKIFRFSMICEICGNSYRSIGSLNTHKRDKHFNQRNTCIVCNFTALSNWRIVQHQRKRHIVEPGLPEDVANKSRARTESKTTFSNEARQAFDWRREMRKKMKPGEKFFGCCRCKIIFNTRKEKVLHNKTEHPITEFTVVCLLCLPNKLLLSNGNGARRHYIDIHKVPWYEIDGLVKCTKPIFNFLNKEEIELLQASENYKELLDELLKDKKLLSVENLKFIDDEASKAVQNLPHLKELDDDSTKIEVECTEEQNVYVDGIIENDHYSENNYKHLEYPSSNEHNYSEEHVINETFNSFDQLVHNDVAEVLYSQQLCEEVTVHTNADVESINSDIRNDPEYDQNISADFVESELIEEGIVVEEYIDEIIGEDAEEYD